MILDEIKLCISRFLELEPMPFLNDENNIDTKKLAHMLDMFEINRAHICAVAISENKIVIAYGDQTVTCSFENIDGKFVPKYEVSTPLLQINQLWKRTDEFLPDNDQEVIVYTETGTIEYNITFLCDVKAGPCFYDRLIGMRMPIIFISHWMPAPTAPRDNCKC
jgi:hypothetical protein